MAGGFSLFQGKGFLSLAGESLREKAKEQSQEIIMGVLEAIGEVFKEASMILTAILIILRAVGFKHPWIRPGVAITMNVLLRVLLGGTTG